MVRVAKKKTSPPPLPPLSLAALEAVEKVEKYARIALLQCSQSWNFNNEKATRILRTCVVEVFNQQLDYYRTLSICDPAWVSEIAETTVDSAIGLISSGDFEYESTKEALLQTLAEHVVQRQANGTVQKLDRATKAVESISHQIRELQDECRMTAEDIAEAIGVAPRTVFRHLAGATPRRRQIASYEKLFSSKTRRHIRFETS